MALQLPLQPASRGVPDTNSVITGTNRQGTFAIGAQFRPRNVSGLMIERNQRNAISGIPNPCSAIGGSSNDAGAIGTVRSAKNPILVLKGRDFVARSRVPDFRSLVPTGAEHVASVPA